ncbi:proline dehydrogenase/oxidase [Volvox carteri f. nagariensis]|uniref:Proline dehydrogenase n=1 Tax=Volvox carteri f. nagariensis TaxID=3068 RepID=D8U5M5_VOLCA|nr:proline dehydrogenase/oxidase [Volvox carteri f. nagariensis]EFJ44944.1 proline dehydrogenase/oxidase [Volvox carteri f. nagariensis]|eukprot:XP_002953915.1 proline dehydrogenase/oxidase [Volvox carteri f. nagariensis]
MLRLGTLFLRNPAPFALGPTLIRFPPSCFPPYLRTRSIPPPRPTLPTLKDHAAIFEGRSTSDLLRALLVLRLCATTPFVTHSEALLDSARSLLGDRIAMSAVQESFYKHFCAGKEPADVWARMNALRAHGIGAILDYAEEEDLLKHCKPRQQEQEQGVTAAVAAAKEVEAGGGGAEARAKGKGRYAVITARQPLGGETIIQSRVAARTYDHSGEDDECERHATAFLSAIDTAATLPGQGFAAIKLTALGDPGLLEHLAAAVGSVRELFQTYDLDGDGYITQAEFEECFQKVAAEQGSTSSVDERSELWRWLDPEQQGRIDYISWTQRLNLAHMPELAASLEQQARATGPGRPWELSPSERVQLQGLLRRLERLVERAVSKGVKLMIDAEQSSLRPAIDHIAHELMRRHNTAAGGASGPGEAVIFVTYQAYLRDAQQRLADDLDRARRERYTLGAKLVRGAYLHLERRRAAEAGVPSPVWDHIEQTHASFDGCLEVLLGAVKAGRAEVMMGSHNQASVEAAVAAMSKLGLEPEDAPVYFGQLMGMADNLSFTLGHHGYKVFKYCPYGSVEKVIPYLLRRVNENQYILKGGKQDVALLWAELWRRALHDPNQSPLARVLAPLQSSSSSSVA